MLFNFQFEHILITWRRHNSWKGPLYLWQNKNEVNVIATILNLFFCLSHLEIFYSNGEGHLYDIYTFARCVLTVFYTVEQGGIFIVPRLLCHLASVFAVSLDAQPHCMDLCDKQELIRSYSDQQYERNSVPEIVIRNNW